MVSISWWEQYINWNARKGNIHPEYGIFRLLPGRSRGPFRCFVTVADNVEYEAYGLFQAVVNISGIDVVTSFYITYDQRFKKIMLGQEVWSPIPCQDKVNMNPKSIQVASLEVEDFPEVNTAAAVEAPMLGNSKVEISIAGKGVTALCDTGAGVTLMTCATFLSLGYTHEDLLPSLYAMRNANGGDLPSLGMSPPVTFKLNGSSLSMSFCIVDSLINEVILGRDFMIMYDVLVDVPGQRLLLRNVVQSYATKVEQTMLGSKMRCIITAPRSALSEQTSGYVKCTIRPVAAMLPTWGKWMRNQTGNVPVWIEGNVSSSQSAPQKDIAIFECVTSLNKNEIMIPLSVSETWALDIEGKSDRQISVRMNILALKETASRVDLDGSPLTCERYEAMRNIAAVNSLVDSALLFWDAWSSLCDGGDQSIEEIEPQKLPTPKGHVPAAAHSPEPPLVKPKKVFLTHPSLEHLKDDLTTVEL
jgi:predicted aspartyl protease